MMPWLAMVLLLHPGHMTRIELRVSDDAKARCSKELSRNNFPICTSVFPG